MNPFQAKSFAIGYYYGRSGREDLAVVDRALDNDTMFKIGFEAGMSDFWTIDLVEQSENEQVSD